MLMLVGDERISSDNELKITGAEEHTTQQQQRRIAAR